MFSYIYFRIHRYSRTSRRNTRYISLVKIITNGYTEQKPINAVCLWGEGDAGKYFNQTITWEKKAASRETSNSNCKANCLNLTIRVCRAMDFLVELFRNLYQHQDWSMQQACNDSYGKTLKKWHGWIASSSFTVSVTSFYYECTHSDPNEPKVGFFMLFC